MHVHGNDHAKVDPVPQTCSEDNGNLHHVEDGAAEIREELEELVLFWAGALATWAKTLLEG